MDELCNLLRNCTPEGRKYIAMNITNKYTYTIYNVKELPGMFKDCYRNEHYERGDVTYAIFHPSQHYDDDMMPLRWNSKERIWTASFLDKFSSIEFPEGKPIYEGDLDSVERAALVLLTHFRLLHRRCEFHPIRLAVLSPEELDKLAAGALKPFASAESEHKELQDERLSELREQLINKKWLDEFRSVCEEIKRIR